MMRRISILRAGFLLALPCLGASPSFGQATEKRPWEPRDSIALRYFSTDQDGPAFWPSSTGTEVNPSPAGKHFFVTSVNGDLTTDSLVYRVQVWETDTVKSALAKGQAQPAKYDLKFNQYTNFSGFRYGRWSSDGRFLYFFGTTENRTVQLHRLDVKTGKQVQISGGDKNAYEYSEAAGTAVYSSVYEASFERMKYPMEQLMPNRFDGYSLKEVRAAYSPLVDLYVSYRDGQPKLIDSQIKYSYIIEPCQPKISPDGRWVAYSNGSQVKIVDAATGQSQTVTEGRVYNIQWKSNSAAVIPTYSIPNGDIRKAEVISHRVVFENRKWVLKSSTRLQGFPPSEALAPPEKLPGIEVKVKQGPNDPPVLIATDATHEVALSEPDPVLQQVWWARTEPVSWKEPNGDTITGGCATRMKD